MEGKEILVTGGAGFIGSRLVKFLEDEGNEVVSLDKADDSGPYQPQDISNRETVEKVFSNHDFDHVFHLAAEADVWASDVQALYRDNIRGTYIIGEYASKHETPLTFTSSIAAVNPVNDYGRTKAAGEHILDIFDADFRIFRLSNVVGEGAVRGQVHAMIQQAIRNEEIEVWSNGEIKRSYVAVNDVVRVLDNSRKRRWDDDDVGLENFSNEDIAELIQEIFEDKFGKSVSLEFIDRKPPSPLELQADMEEINIPEPTPITDAIEKQIASQYPGDA